MKYKLFSAILILTLFVPIYSFAEQSIQLARCPAPSPDGKTVVFTYQGDIWKVDITGGNAFRLTVHKAYDRYPQWSPAGGEIMMFSIYGKWI